MWRGLALVRWMIMAGRVGLQTAHNDHSARVQVYNIYCIAPPFSIRIHIPPLFFHPPPHPLGLLPSESTTPTLRHLLHFQGDLSGRGVQIARKVREWNRAFWRMSSPCASLRGAGALDVDYILYVMLTYSSSGRAFA